MGEGGGGGGGGGVGVRVGVWEVICAWLAWPTVAEAFVGSILLLRLFSCERHVGSRRVASFFVCALVVSAACAISHAHWLRTLGGGGGCRGRRSARVPGLGSVGGVRCPAGAPSCGGPNTGAVYAVRPRTRERQGRGGPARAPGPAHTPTQDTRAHTHTRTLLCKGTDDTQRQMAMCRGISSLIPVAPGLLLGLAFAYLQPLQRLECSPNFFAPGMCMHTYKPPPYTQITLPTTAAASLLPQL